jgi:DNA-binding SARP family transcriptional activator/predicted ATPase/Tfp pilus assembly protein PilF
MTARLTIHTLGQLTITLDGQPLTSLSSRTAEALLIYLICEKRPLSRQFLADFLWDERTPERAAANLRTLLTMLRKALGDFLQITRQSVAFDFESDYWLDTAALEEQLAALKPVLQGQIAPDAETLSALQTAVDLYQGNFLQGFYLTESRGFEEWMLLMQERLQRQVKAGWQVLVAHYLENGLYERGILYANRLLALDPFYEAGHRQLMWLLVRSGQPNAALQQYQTCRQILDEELAVEPAPATTAVYERIRSLSLPPPYRLPAQPGPFIGRQAELTAVTQQLALADCRLLTLIGPGGMGKTRLAVESARRLHQQRPGLFLDGVLFIALDPVESATYLPLTIAENVGLTLQGAADPAQQVVNFLAGRELLLVLDNFEHLLVEPADSLALLATILAGAPGITLLVTSRHRLNLREEWLFDLNGLSYPQTTDDRKKTMDDGQWTPDQTSQFSLPLPQTSYRQYSALQFFVQQAQRLRHTFTPTDEDWQAIIRLCQLLEGLPLGLELAAAWIRWESCADIVTRLEKSPETLATQLYNVPGRHRSLTAVFHHSWDLLSEREQRCFARLSIFRGGFTPAAAQAVAQADPETLRGLVDKSLLRRDEANGRYTMHPLLRQFAADQLINGLDQDGEKTAAATAHGRYFAQRLADREHRLSSPDEQAWLETLRTDLPDLRAAWLWAGRLAPQESGPLTAMLYSLAYLYDVQALYREGIDLLQTAVTHLTGSDAPLSQGRLMAWIGRFQYHLGQFDDARHSLDTALTLLRPLDAAAALALALTYRGELARFENDFGPARRYQTESVTLARAAGSDQIEALALLHTGKIDIAEAEYQAAQQVCEAGLALAQQGGAPRQIAIFEDNLGTIFLELGDYETARQKFKAGYELRRTLGDQWGVGASLNNLGVLALITGSYAEAVEKYRQAEALFRQIGHRPGVALALTNLGRAFCYQQAYGAAEKTLQQALHLCQEVGSQLEEGDSWLYLGQTALYGGDYHKARAYLEKSLALFTRLGDDRQLSIVWRDLGVALTRLGDMASANRYLRLSLDAGVAQDLTPDILYALSGWGVWLGAGGKTVAAGQLLKLAATHPSAWHHEQAAARQILEELGQAETAVSPPALTVETAVALVNSEGKA